MELDRAVTVSAVTGILINFNQCANGIIGCFYHAAITAFALCKSFVVCKPVIYFSADGPGNAAIITDPYPHFTTGFGTGRIQHHNTVGRTGVPYNRTLASGIEQYIIRCKGAEAACQRAA